MMGVKEYASKHCIGKKVSVVCPDPAKRFDILIRIGSLLALDDLGIVIYERTDYGKEIRIINWKNILYISCDE